MSVSQSEQTPVVVKIGIALTAFVLLGVGLLGFFEACDDSGECAARWRLLWSAPANEIGDTLAGVGSVLAFIWLIVAIFLQKYELTLQRSELGQQRKEWAKISAAQDAQVSILERQSEIFAEEQIRRDQDRADSEFFGLMDSFLVHALGVIDWDTGRPLFANADKGSDSREKFKSFCAILYTRVSDLQDHAINESMGGARYDICFRQEPFHAERCLRRLHRINQLSECMSPRQLMFYNDCNVFLASGMLKFLLEQHLLWLSPPHMEDGILGSGS